MGIPKRNEDYTHDELNFPACPGEKINFNGIIYCASSEIEEEHCDGLCRNCLNQQFCVWEENNKIFCEHYQ